MKFNDEGDEAESVVVTMDGDNEEVQANVVVGITSERDLNTSFFISRANRVKTTAVPAMGIIKVQVPLRQLGSSSVPSASAAARYIVVASASAVARHILRRKCLCGSSAHPLRKCLCDSSTHSQCQRLCASSAHPRC